MAKIEAIEVTLTDAHRLLATKVIRCEQLSCRFDDGEGDCSLKGIVLSGIGASCMMVEELAR